MSGYPFKRFFFVAISILVVLAMVNGSAFAAATAKQLSTNFTLVNLGTAPAAVEISYKTDSASGGTNWQGVSPNNVSFTLAENGGQNQIRQYSDNTMVSGSGSAVVSSSQQLAAVVQIQARNQTPSNGAYIGVSQGSDTFYIPLVSRHGISASGLVNSQIIIQNAGTSGDVVAHVELIPISGYTATVSKDIPIAQGISYYYDLETEAQLPSTGWFGSAIVSTTTTGGSLVVVSNLFSGPDGLQTYNAFPKESLTDKWMVPIFTSQLSNGLSTVVTIQNLGADLAMNDIHLDCKVDGSDTVTLSKTNPDIIKKNAGYSFNPVNSAAYPVGWFGSCVVTAPTGSQIVAFVQMRVVGRSVANVAAYEAISGAQTSKSIFVPLVAQHLTNGFATVVNIANLADVPNTVHLEYIPSSKECTVAGCDKNGDGIVNGNDVRTYDETIPASGGIQRSHRFGTELPDGWIGTLKVTSTSNLPIGGIVQLTNYIDQPGDTLMAHDAFAQ